MLLKGVYFNKFLFVLLFIFYIFYYKNKCYYYIKLITSYLSNIKLNFVYKVAVDLKFKFLARFYLFKL